MSKYNNIRRKILPKLDPLDGVIGKTIPPTGKKRKLIREKGGEYVFSVSCSEEELVQALSRYGYKYNPISTLKFIEDNGRLSWEQGSMAYRESFSSYWMNHAYWFEASENGYTFHISHHRERNYLDLPNGPSEHTSRGDDFYTKGDPDNHLRKALHESDIDFIQLENEEYDYENAN